MPELIPDSDLLQPPDFIQLLDEDGGRVPNPEFDRWVRDIGATELGALYDDLVVVRRLDVEATALQRQGELGLWPPLLGQEAAQIGSARALRPDDFVFSSYRENAVAYCRGVGLTDLVKMWRGSAQSGWDPASVGMAVPAIIIGAQTLHATGWALGAQFDGVDAVAVTYFGDGATSEGDVNEAMVFAASFQVPVVFFCQNNQWAISEPVGLQARVHIANRAPGFGIPALRVDGNDVLAVMAATRVALDRARSGNGPTFIEAVTYRMGPHTTADDPTRYRDPADLAAWAKRDPILRLRRLLEAEGLFTPEFEAAVAAHADAAAAELRAGCIALPDPHPLSVFDHVYTTPQATLDGQRDGYAEYLASFDSAGSTSSSTSSKGASV
ncbi:pyruvate dehydrogenase (acetyl-transferring) E1 component subunit alpha [Cryobacterium frigoriphilum]|uniref:Pyruvate dehydrogenase (Acetyl-transferring) E1 component subunit alpha n=1 Tax=Cryobacterium frigoriphilum TaxID=1259150 RepID=A0A4R8ZYC2_9MICO|nr:pyruvate dehydrogenase (acetyl-transferring) E1 component subunit alpha [Cryobacterium frigoriphilum]TFD48792.1 pyruvate dehydrogenase (acetyl-transferring) E1 component subunit alpha [Cryobacterium frigoriphilum]